jgi:hypothetical protein
VFKVTGFTGALVAVACSARGSSGDAGLEPRPADVANDIAPDSPPDAVVCEGEPISGTGSLAWVQRSSSSNNNQPFGLTVTTSGDLALGGQYSGTIKLSPDSATPPSFTAKGQYDLWLTRWHDDGTLMWARAAGTSVQSHVSALGPAPADDVYVGGTTYAYPSDPLVLGAGEPSQATFTRYGTFFARYHVDGTLVWAKIQQNGGAPYRVLAAPDGGFFAAGDAGSFAATFGVGEPHETALIARAVPVSTPTFVARFAVDGQLGWVRTLGGVHPDAALMADGGVVVVGLFGGDTAVFEGGGVPDVSLVADWYDLFIASYSSTGDLRWVKTVKGLPQVDPRATTVLASGDIVVSATCEPKTGTTDETDAQAVFGPGEANETRITCADFDLVFAGYTPGGQLVWARSVPPLSPELRGLTPLADGGFVMASAYRKPDPAVFDGGACGPLSLSRLGQDANLVVSWHRPDGTARLARVVATGYTRVLGVSVLGGGSVVIAGAFGGTTTFGPLDPAKVSYTKSGSGEDTFLVRLQP